MFVRLAETRAHPTALLRRAESGELVILWANRAAVARLGGDTGSLRSISAEYPHWEAVCAAALASGRPIETDAENLVYSVTPLDAHTLAIESRPRESRFDMLFSQFIDGVFFMQLDEPIDWHNGDKEALLDYAFDHLRITMINEAMCEQIGRPRNELLGTVPRDRWVRSAEAWRRNMHVLYDQGQVHHSLCAKYENDHWVEGAYVCTYDAQGRITGHYGTQRDVNNEREAALELARSQHRLELAIEGGEIGVWEYDPVRHTVIYDRHWMARFGFDLDRTPWTETQWWANRMH
ncbi:MAG: hypothetical protein JO257_13090, partial [Deltaproteobacteria bacterium]|nr:hypothetical protein [Deltaproteobacteria bacterium]